MILRGTVRDPETGVPVPDGTPVEVRRRDDNSLIASLTTQAGAYEYVADGNPGQFKVVVTSGDETKITSSWAVGPAGAADVSGLPLYFRLWTDGYIPGLWGELAVSADGTGLAVNVARGAAIARGIIYDQRVGNPKSLAIAAADATNPRIDTVVVRVIPAGVDPNTEGTSLVAVKTGTPAGTPVAPALVQDDASLWEIALADVRVDAGVTAIAADKVTDRRVIATPGIGNEQVDDRVAALILPGSGLTKSYNDPGNALTLGADPEFIRDTVAAQLRAGTGITLTNDDPGDALTIAAGIRSGEGKDDGTISAGNLADTRTLVFDDVGFGAFSPAAFIQYIFLNFGNTAGRVAEGNHVHNPALLNFWIINDTGQLPTTGVRTLLNQSSYVPVADVEYNSFAFMVVGVQNDFDNGDIDLSIKIGSQATRTRRVHTVGGVPVDRLVVDVRTFTGGGSPLTILGTVQHAGGSVSAIFNGFAGFFAWPRR